MSITRRIGIALPCAILLLSTVSCCSSKISVKTGENKTQELIVTCKDFKNNEFIPKKHTGFGQDISPEFQLGNLTPQAVSIVITMDDLDIPCMKSLNHWVIWNIPRMETIPENIPYGTPVISLGNAIQGNAYGKNRYRGPKQPFFIKSAHRYVFELYVLDCTLSLPMTASKKDVIQAMQGHIMQYGNILGLYQRD